MSTAQITAFQPRTTPLHGVRRDVSVLKPSTLRFPCSSVKTQFKFNLKCSNRTLRPRRSSSIVCSSDSGADSQGSPWKAFEKALGNVTRGQSIEDVLKQQIEKQEYYPEQDGGGGGEGSGGDGGGNGDADGSGGMEGEDSENVWDEIVQVVLATAGFIFLYIYILDGEELVKLARDYLKTVLFKGPDSVRLKRCKKRLKRMWDRFKPIEVGEDPFWLERAIINTPTVYDSPVKYREFFGFPDEPALPVEIEPEPVYDSDDDYGT